MLLVLTFDTTNLQVDVFTGVFLIGALVAACVFVAALHDWRLARRIETTHVEDTTALMLLIVTGTSIVTHSIVGTVGLFGMVHVRPSTWVTVAMLSTGAVLDIICLPFLLRLLLRMRRSLLGRRRLSN